MSTNDLRPASTPHRRGLRIRLPGGVPLIVAPSWLLLALFITVLSMPLTRQVTGIGHTAAVLAIGAAAALILGLSVLAHEFGHVAAAQHYGIPVREIRLYFVGGASELTRPAGSPGSDAVIAAAGPAVSAALAGVGSIAMVFVPDQSAAWLMVAELAWINVIVAAFNILPASPLDGGRVITAVVWRITGRLSAGMTAAMMGGFVLAAALVGAGIWALFAMGRSGLLLAAVLVSMSAFIAAGAWSDRVLPGHNSAHADLQPREQDIHEH